MRVYAPPGAGSAPILLRNPTTIQTRVQTVAGSIINLGSYTVPANRAALLTALATGWISIPLDATQGADIRLEITPSGGAANDIELLRWQAVGISGRNSMAKPVTVTLQAGDRIRWQGGVDAGAGRLTVWLMLIGTEYDA